MTRIGLLVTLAVAVLVSFAPDAAAQRRRGQTAEPAPPPEPTEPNANIVALMNGLTWGMSKDQVVEAVKLEIKNKYWPQIQAVADDAVAEQGLRTRMERDQQRFVDSCVKFDGQQTPWNVSMVDTEFTHNNQEEMCKFDRGDATDFLFFIRGKLWKIFRTLNQGIGGGGATFEDMRAQLEGQFGTGEEMRSVDQYTLVSEVVGVKWIDSQTEMALRTLSLYGVLAVVLTERATLANLATLRRAVATESDQGSGLTDAVTEGTAQDENSDIVDRLRGTRPDPTAPPATNP
ncbi:MAG: hypothetical protein HY907_18460 [Deltaproteobacteria bacterium]|nr:hypothetical protein [Deltaproteobacteria bacterium]